MSSQKSAATLLVLLASACSKPVPSPESPQTPEREVLPPHFARPVPSRGTPERRLPEEKKALPPICPTRDGLCERIGPVIDALNSSEPKRACSLLDEMGAPDTGDGRGIYLLLKGRCRLESDSLAYGEGGTASEEALVLFRAAEELLQEKDLVRLQVARAQLSLGQGDQAVSTLRALGTSYQGDAEVQAALGIAYIATGRAARALAPLRLAASLDPKQPERLIVLGTAHMLLGDLVEAERQFRVALSLDSASERAHGDLGTSLLIQGKIPEGKAHLLRAAALAPQRATYASNLSYAELLSNQPDLAEKWAHKALELDPELASAWLNLGLAQVAKGEREAARVSFEKAGKLDPSDPRVENNLRDLDELESTRPSGTPEPD